MNKRACFDDVSFFVSAEQCESEVQLYEELQKNGSSEYMHNGTNEVY